MPDNTIIIKANDYQYPSREERKKIYASEPVLRNFGFANVSPLVAMFNENKDAATAHQLSSLYWWDLCLQNRIGNLSQAYLNSLIHYERGIPDDIKDFQDHHYINRIQFDFYAETFYYFFSTVKDNVGQVLNVYFSLGLKETDIHFNVGFAKKMPNTPVQKAVETFSNNTKQTTIYRNSFTHRYMPNQPDNRDGFEVKNGQTVFYSSTGDFVTTREFKDNILQSQQELSALLNTLRSLLIA